MRLCLRLPQYVTRLVIVVTIAIGLSSYGGKAAVKTGTSGIDEMVLADEPMRWTALGFTVVDGCCQLGRVRLRFRGLRSWAANRLLVAARDRWRRARWAADDRSESSVPAAAPAHPNGALAIDHIVAMSPALERSVRALEAAGLDSRTIREQPTPAGAPRHAFLRLGADILEVVQEPDGVVERGGGPARPAPRWALP